MRHKIFLVLLLMLALELTMGLKLSQEVSEEAKIIVAFDPDKYIWDTPLPDSWVAYIKPTAGCEVDDIDLSAILLEKLYPPISLKISKNEICAGFEPANIKETLDWKIFHMTEPLGLPAHVEVGVFARKWDGGEVRGFDIIRIYPK